MIGFFHVGPYFTKSDLMSWIFPFFLALQGYLMEQIVDRNKILNMIKAWFRKLIAPLLRKVWSVPQSQTAMEMKK